VSYPRLEIIAKLATVLECEPAELLRVPGAAEILAREVKERAVGCHDPKSTRYSIRRGVR
jgi:hypothetical protein